MSKVTVYSCVTGNYDNVYKAILASANILESDVEFVLYTDSQLQHNGQVITPGNYVSPVSRIIWQVRPLLWQHAFCDTRTARFHKVNSHLAAPDCNYSVWVDGSQLIKYIKLWEELSKHIQPGVGIQTFKHPQRTCVYQELEACKRLRKDNAELMTRQVKSYRQDGYPPYNGMVETACVVRKHTEETITFNRVWWEEITRHSYRDQLSFNYCSWKTGITYGYIPGHRDNSPFFLFKPHKS